MIEINKTFVTSDHHFREWTHFGGLLCESPKEVQGRGDEARRVM